MRHRAFETRVQILQNLHPETLKVSDPFSFKENSSSTH